MNLEAQCPACGSLKVALFKVEDSEHRARFVELSRDRYSSIMDDWNISLDIMRCLCCDHCWYREQPTFDALMLMYAAHIPSRVSSDEPSERALAEMSTLLKLVNCSKQPRLLDFGAGAGRWTRAAAKCGFDVVAYEPSLERAYGNRLPSDSFEMVTDLRSVEDGSFDAINIEQVLEHVQNPLETLLDLSRLCHADTVLRISVPNILRPQEGLRCWSNWPYDGHRVHTLSPFEHLHGFTPRSLRSVVMLAGFRPFYTAKMFLRRSAELIVPSTGQTLVYARLCNRS